jgi:hypothetical protein
MACITTKRYKDKETGQTRETMVIDFYDQHGKRRLETLPEKTTKKKANGRLRGDRGECGKGNLPTGKENANLQGSGGRMAGAQEAESP